MERASPSSPSSAPSQDLSPSALAIVVFSLLVRFEVSAPGSFFSTSIVCSRMVFFNSSSQARLRSSSSPSPSPRPGRGSAVPSMSPLVYERQLSFPEEPPAPVEDRALPHARLLGERGGVLAGGEPAREHALLLVGQVSGGFFPEGLPSAAWSLQLATELLEEPVTRAASAALPPHSPRT